MEPDLPLDDAERAALERLTEEFLERHRSGETVDADAFAREHPEHERHIRALFPMLLDLEEARGPEPAGERERFGRWRVERELGRGGMGVVYLARDETTGERVALKLLTTDAPAAISRFRREAAAVARVEHPGICRVVEVGREGDRLWIALEYVEGETLAAALRRERRERETGSGAPGEPRDPDRWLAVAERVAQALHAAHEVGLVHRDVKPANVMLAADGRVVVLDFGLAHADAGGDATRLTQTGVPIGTPAYMSPEQVQAGLVPVDRRTDVWSLGATLYEALTLQPPFAGPTIAALFRQVLTSEPEPARRRNPAISRDLEVVLATALEKAPERRYASARLLAEDLARARAGRRVRARAAGPLRRVATWAARHRGVAAAVGAVALALVLGLVVALVLLDRVSEARDREATTARRARAIALASASADAQPTDAMLALLLAREAVRAQRSPETVSQLHAAVHGSLERARLAGHDGAIVSVAWDDAGSRVATGSQDGRARLFEAGGRLLAAVPPEGSARAGDVFVALSASGTRWATRHANGAVRLWRDDGTEVAPLPRQEEPPLDVAFLDDDALAVTTSREVALFGPDGAPRGRRRIGAEAGTSVVAARVASTPAALHVLTRGGVAISYDARGDETSRREQAARAPFARLLDGGRLAWLEPAEPGGVVGVLHAVRADGAPDGSVRGAFPQDTALCAGDSWWCVWSPSYGAMVVQGTDERLRFPLDLQRSERPSLLLASRDGSCLFTARREQGVNASGRITTDALRLWTPLGASLGAPTAGDDLVPAAALSPDGRRLALGRHSGGAATVHATAPEELATVVPRWREQKYVYVPKIAADGRAMLAFAGDRRARVLRDDGSTRAEWTFEEPEGGSIVFSSFLSADGRFLAVGRSGAAWVHDLDGAVRLRLPPKPRVEQAFWLGRDGRFATTVVGPRVRFHAADGSVVAEVAGRPLPPDPAETGREELAIAAEDGVRVHGPDGTLRRTLPVPAHEEAFWFHDSPSGLCVTLTHADAVKATCRAFDAAGRALWDAPVGGVGNLSAFVSRDGERVAFQVSGGVSLRDRAGAEVAALRTVGRVTHMAFDAREDRLAVATSDGVVRVWDRAGRPLFDLPNQGGSTFVGFSEDGRRLGTVTTTMARLYTTDGDELEGLARRRSTRELSDPERARFREVLGGGR